MQKPPPENVDKVWRQPQDNQEDPGLGRVGQAGAGGKSLYYARYQERAEPAKHQAIVMISTPIYKL